MRYFVSFLLLFSLPPAFAQEVPAPTVPDLSLMSSEPDTKRTDVSVRSPFRFDFTMALDAIKQAAKKLLCSWVGVLFGVMAIFKIYEEFKSVSDSLEKKQRKKPLYNPDLINWARANRYRPDDVFNNPDLFEKYARYKGLIQDTLISDDDFDDDSDEDYTPPVVSVMSYSSVQFRNYFEDYEDEPAESENVDAAVTETYVFSNTFRRPGGKFVTTAQWNIFKPLFQQIAANDVVQTDNIETLSNHVEMLTQQFSILLDCFATLSMFFGLIFGVLLYVAFMQRK